jgi:hypothetical protein
MTGTPRSRARLNGRCGFQRFSSGRVNGRNRRTLPVPACSGEGRLSERTPAVQPRRQERVKVPRSGRS